MLVRYICIQLPPCNLIQEFGIGKNIISLLSIQKLRVYINRTAQMLELQHDRRTKLIVNADDLGYSASCDEAVFRLIETGIVQSASIIANCEASLLAAEKCKTIGFVPGLHINITEGRPLAKGLKYLVNEKGMFKGKPAFYGPQLLTLNCQEIYEEVNAQIEWFIRHLDRVPSHIDGHNHVHMVPEIARIIVQVMQQHGIYKYRCASDKLLDEPSPFVKQILNNCKESKQYYEARNMITTNYFVGLELIYNFTFENFKAAIESIPSGSTIEVMTHPGSEQKTSGRQDDFHSSQQRLNEFNVWTSQQMKQYLRNFKLTSWRDLQYTKPYNEKRILLHSVMKRGTGNQTSSLRVRDIVASAGYTVYLRNIIEHSEAAKQNEVQDIELFTKQFQINLVIGVNVYRSGMILSQAFYDPNRICNQVPYYLIIAGTDANIYLKKAGLRGTMIKALALSEQIISLNESMKKEVEKALQEQGIFKQIALISQSQSQYQGGQLCEIKKELGLSDKGYIIFPASIRKVKDILFAIKQMNQLIDKYNIEVYIFGPILQQEYSELVFSQLHKVRYFGAINHQKLLTLLQGSICLINTSTSQGMSNAILEAQVNRVIPVVRGNDGNRNLVQHKKSGLVFTTPSEFYENISWILDNPEASKVLAKQTQESAKARFSRQEQEGKYKRILQKHFKEKEVHFVSNNKNFFITQSPFAHPIGQINSRLFNQIPSTKVQSVLDLGCGSGVFTFFYLSKIKQSVKEITLTDISFEAISNCLFNIIQNKEFCYQFSHHIKILRSNMFEEIHKRNIKFDVMLANMPQCPFPVDNVRIDKNGGRDGFCLNSVALKELSQHPKGTSLITLFSYMGNPAKYFKTIQQLSLEIAWRSEKLYHKIMPSLYDIAHPGLTDYLVKMKAEGISDFEIKDNLHHIGAQILIIRQK